MLDTVKAASYNLMVKKQLSTWIHRSLRDSLHDILCSDQVFRFGWFEDQKLSKQNKPKRFLKKTRLYSSNVTNNVYIQTNNTYTNNKIIREPFSSTNETKIFLYRQQTRGICRAYY